MTQIATARVLITGFGSFPGVPENASAVVVERLALSIAALPGVRLTWRILPVDWEVAPRQVAELIADENPQVILHFGVSRRAEGLVIETLARNHCHSSVDICGSFPLAPKIAADAPDALPSTFPAASIVDRLRAEGFPAQLSEDAGGYLCNNVLYTSLNRLSGNNSCIGFVHLPVDLSGKNGRLSVDDIVNGGVAILQTCLEERGF
ncbi:Peptidase C15 pyroglutamyl peptidase I [Candidatus Filomicrobium marinum]|uniref:Pyroglutamyl-peptidase I n=2 Tax=Filomicrobium TaxID=119044 RepID=A0A0D6JH57_9HYPH|nr:MULTISPECIES: pyroglutamyl-peptidase I [Filomicrobium]MCV0369901.1 pyroglutamyl-peptidase I [Filomicrobium sp.]CFX53295.1 Peptidase C15 pyroglutamyl peptidase I [Candidatus Filomicrobium marinum]CPR19943.1 Peptidase C15 pyroglutamyl peptidase I [Candidatus Filomicrobium marinum]SDP07574.1 pyroglutamyl-peptidase [Filomicrobium insigne]